MSFSIFMRTYILQFLLSVIIGYLLGSISFSIIFTKHFEHKDIRDLGSGNAGFTNVLRSAGVLPSVLTFIFDLLKCGLSIYLANITFCLFFGSSDSNFIAMQANAYLAGLACVLGHIYPCFFKLKGGKGVITVAASALFTDWRIFLLCISVFLIALCFSKIVSLSSIIAGICLPIIAFTVKFFLDYLPSKSLNLSYVFLSVAFYILVSSLVIFKHKDNIKRLRLGQEKTIKVKFRN